MKTKTILLGALTAIIPATTNADDQTTTLVYPAPAAEVELDNSTPAKRATPPVREETEFDPVTPLGQIRAVKDSLERLEAAQEEIQAELRKSARTLSDDEGFLSRFNSLFPLIERTANDGEAIKTDVDALMKTTDGIGAKIDALAKTTENLRATVEAAQKTVESVEKIRTSRWTDYAVVAILALVLLQLLGKAGAVAVKAFQASRERLDARVYELAEQLVKSKQNKTTTKKTE